ncbi:MAG: nucleotidyltransferase, partial [Desulfuromonadales bacterium]|nr:nucleotidyltransferase [Desulfuromonadales bacterium]NIS43898.1 nucleotidyltransferase [Desulfuromonadales bacterium]
TIFNPFYTVADNIGSCWAAKDLIGEDTLLLNGDTLFEPAIAERVIETAEAPISVTVDRKDSYDADDMKIH